MRYWLDGLKKVRLVEPRPRRDEPLKPARPLIEPLCALATQAQMQAEGNYAK